MSNIFYVYKHVDPLYNMVVYIGKGCHGRAWDVTRCRNEHKEHQSWMKELCTLGYTPDDWVEIVQKGMSEKEALDLEHKLINTFGCPVYNRQSGEKQHQAKLSNQQAIEVYTLAKEGKLLHREIAEKYDISRTCVSMIASVKQWKAVLLPYIKELNEKRG
jgi:hypothetical protein